jgi:hypothetical protein
MTSYDYMIVDPCNLMVFIINYKNNVVLNAICDYVLSHKTFSITQIIFLKIVIIYFD